MTTEADPEAGRAPERRQRRRLIVNADDFGESPFVNTAIIQAFRQGILTSTSLMVTGEAFDQAVSLARANPDLEVGLHVVLVDGRSCLSPQAIPDLVDAQGFFPKDPIMTGIRWSFRPTVRQQIRREVRAQAERFLATGLALDHLNSHYHFHVHLAIFDALVEVAEEIGTRHIRLPAESLWPFLELDRSDFPRKLGYVAKFNFPSWCHRHRLKARGFGVIDGLLGLFQTGSVNQQYLLDLLRKLPKGTYELYAHPRLDTEAGLRELRALTSLRVRQAIQERGIRLTTYSQLTGDQG
jgi:hopanoid biosynthesis associated protein HpnK